MSPDPNALLIAVVFAAQILVCSFLSAWSIARGVRTMRQKYPPQEYPRLYPIGPEQMQRQFLLRNALRLAIGAAAIFVLAFSLSRGSNADRLADYMIWVAMAQLLPMLLALPQQIRMARALRAMPAPAVRSAELRPWRVTDYISPAEVALGITASCVALASSAWLYLQHQPRHLAPLALGFVINGLALLRMLYVLLGPVTMSRPDPFMGEDDLFRARRTRMRTLFRMAIFMGVYFAFMEFWGTGVLRIDRAYIAAGISILLQIASLYMGYRMLHPVRERDLTPYRVDAEQKAG